MSRRPSRSGALRSGALRSGALRSGALRSGAATAAFALACLVSLVVLFAPRSGPAGRVPHLDLAVHASVFGLLVLTGLLRFGRPRAVLPAAAGYAVLSELVQHVALPGRTGDPVDVLADVAGALLGLAAVAAVRRRGGARRRDAARAGAGTPAEATPPPPHGG